MTSLVSLYYVCVTVRVHRPLLLDEINEKKIDTRKENIHTGFAVFDATVSGADSVA